MLEVILNLRCDLCGEYAKGYPYGEIGEWRLDQNNAMYEPYKVEMRYECTRSWTAVYWSHPAAMLHFCPKHKIGPNEPIIDGKHISEHWPLEWKSVKPKGDSFDDLLTVKQVVSRKAT